VTPPSAMVVISGNRQEASAGGIELTMVDLDQPDTSPSWFTQHRLLSTITVLAGIVFVFFYCYEFWRGTLEHESTRKGWDVTSCLEEWCREHDELPPPGTAVAIHPEFPVQCPMTGSHFVWMTEPSGERLSCDMVSADGNRFHGFIAGSEKSTWDGRRCFIFLDTEWSGAEILSDDEVDWTTQTRRPD